MIKVFLVSTERWEMMIIAKIAAVGIIAGVLALTVKKSKPELAMQLSIAAGILIFLMALEYLKEAVDFVKEFSNTLNGMYEGIQLVLKVVGIAYISEFAAQSLCDAGEGAIAKKVELAGKLLIVVLTLPLLKQFAELIFSLAEGL